MPALGVQIDGRGVAILDPERLVGQRRLREVPASLAHDQDHVAVRRQSRDQVVQRLKQADAADGRGGQDRLAVGFVVKRHVARHDGEVERAARLADAFDRADELAHDLGLFGVAEVEVVGRGQGRRAAGDEVAPRLGHRLPAALHGVRADVAGRHVAGEGQRLVGAVDPHDPGAKARAAHRVGADLGVVLFPDPRLVGVAGRSDERPQRRDRRDLRQRHVGPRGRRLDPRAVVFRRAGRQLRQRKIGLHLVAVEDEEAVLGNRLAHDGEVEVPLLEDLARHGFLFGMQDHEHAFLALGQHHLIGGHRGFPHRHPVEVQPDPQPPLVAHLDGRAGQPRRAHVLDRDDRARLHQFEAGFQQAFLGEGVAHLHGGALFLDGVVELGAGHGRAADAVAAGLGAQIDDRHADAGRGRIEDAVGLCDPGGKGVHEAVAVIGAVETDLAAHVRDAEGVAVGADPLDHALDQMRGARVVGPAE